MAYLVSPQVTLTTVSGLIYPDIKPDGEFTSHQYVTKDIVEGCKKMVNSPSGFRLSFDEKTKDVVDCLQLDVKENIRIGMIISNFTNLVDQDFLKPKEKKKKTSKRAQTGSGMALGSQVSFTLLLSTVKCAKCDCYAWYGIDNPIFCSEHREEECSGFFTMSNTIKVFRNGKLNITDGKIIDRMSTQPVLAPVMYEFVEYLTDYLSRKMVVPLKCYNFNIEMKNFKSHATDEFSKMRFNLVKLRQVIEQELKEQSFPELSEVKLTDKQTLSVGINLRKVEGAIKKHSTIVLIYNGRGLKINYKGKNNVVDVATTHQWLSSLIEKNDVIYIERCSTLCKYGNCSECDSITRCSVCKFCYTCHKATKT